MLREKAKASKRQAILKAAAGHFARRPYREVLLDEIAADAEVAKGTVYLYFKNKADLYLALVFAALSPLLKRLEVDVPAAAERSAIAGIELFIIEMLKFRLEHPGIDEVIRETSPAAVIAVCGDLKKSMYGLMEQTIQSGVDRGQLTDPAPRATAELILASVSRAAQWMSLEQNEWSVEQIAAHLVALFGDGLRVRRDQNRTRQNGRKLAKTGVVNE